jgi:hypothetical protein
MLNLYVTDPQYKVIVADGEPEEVEPYRQIAERLSLQDSVKIRSATQPATETLGSASVLVLGRPATGAALDWAEKALPQGVILKPHAFRVGGNVYQQAGHAVLLSIRNPDDPRHVVTFFYGLTPTAAKAIAPLLFFYGWSTYVVFENGKVIARSEDDDPKPRILPDDETK